MNVGMLGALACQCGQQQCHRCPFLKGAVMPMCMGTAARAADWNDLSCCTCAVASCPTCGRSIEGTKREVRVLLEGEV